jgi:hypothetical protein
MGLSQVRRGIVVVEPNYFGHLVEYIQTKADG